MEAMARDPAVAILGGGLMGAATALELACSGVEVLLIEQDPELLNRASLRNEGKIHLGLIYANEGSLDTAGLQLEGALAFRRLLARWLGESSASLPLSSRFVYLVADASICCPDALEAHYVRVDDLYRERLADDPDIDYLGQRPESLYHRYRQVPDHFRGGPVRAGFQTEERAIDTDALARTMRAAIAAHPLVHVLTGVRIKSVRRDQDRLLVEGLSREGHWSRRFEQVVNALWEGRIAIDNRYGWRSEPNWVYRLKYRSIVRLPPGLSHEAPSVTMVLGCFGDVVIRPNRTAYLSWYPFGMRGWSHAVEPPREWATACRGESGDPLAMEIAEASRRELDRWYPGIGQSTTLRADAGVICAHGTTNIDDPASGLHGRARVGLRSEDGYHSVDPGKLTTAPLFALAVAAAVRAH